MRGVVTSLGFTIWAKNMTKGTFRELNRDVLIARANLAGLDRTMLMWTRRMHFAGREARLFSLGMMVSVAAPLVAAAGAAGLATAALIGVGAALAGIGAIGLYAVEKMGDDFLRAHGITEKLSDTFKRLKTQLLRDIAPSFVGTFKAVQGAMERLTPKIADLFKSTAVYMPGIVSAAEKLANRLLPSIQKMFADIGPMVPGAILAWSNLGYVIESIGVAVKNIAPESNRVIASLLNFIGDVIRHFVGNLGPLVGGLADFFEAARPGLIAFFQGFASALNTLAPIMPVLGKFLGDLLAALTPALQALAQALVDNMPFLMTIFGGFVRLVAGIVSNRMAADVIVKMAIAVMTLNAALKITRGLMGTLQLLSLGMFGSTKSYGAAGKSRGSAFSKGLVAGALSIVVADEILKGLAGEGIGWMFQQVRTSFNKGYENGGGFFGGMVKAFEDFIGGYKPSKAMKNSPIGQFMTGFDPDERGKFVMPDQESSEIPEPKRPELGGLAAIGQNIRTTWENFGTFFFNIGQNIGRTVQNIMNWFGSLGDWTRNIFTVTIPGALRNLGAWFSGVWTNIRNGVANAWNWMYDHSIGPMINFFRTGIPAALRAMGSWFTAVWGRIRSFVVAAWNFMYTNAIGKIISFFRNGIPAALRAIRDWFVAVWARIRTFVVGAWNFMYANAIGKIVSFFRNTVPAALRVIRDWFVAVWSRIRTFVVGAWNFMYANAIGKVVSFFRNTVPAALRALRDWFVAVWGRIRTFVVAAWNFIYANAIGKIVSFFRNTVPAALRSLRDWFVAVWSRIRAFVVSAWNTIYTTVVARIISFFRNGIPAALRSLRDWFVAVWNNIRSFLVSVWGRIYANVVAPIIRFFRVTIPAAAQHLRNRVVDFFTGMRNTLTSIRNGINNAVVQPIVKFFRDTIPGAARTMASRIRTAFNNAKNWIGDVWAGIRRTVALPVNWVIRNVYRGGIKKLWDMIATKLGAKKLPNMETIRLAAGGPVRGPGTGTSDSIPAMLSNGEHVLTAEEVRRAGGHGAIMAMRSSLLNGRQVRGPVDKTPGSYAPGFKDGGFWGDLKDFGSKLLSGPKKIWDGFKDATRGFLGEVTDPVLNWVEKAITQNIPRTPPYMSLIRMTAQQFPKWFKEFISKDDEKHGFVGGIGDYREMFKWIKKRVPGTSMSSGYRPGDPGYHGKKLATDLVFADGSERRGGPGKGMAGKAFNLIKKAFKPEIAELIWDFAKGQAVWMGKDHFMTGPSAGPGTHNDHIHWAMRSAAKGSGKMGGSGVERWRPLVMRVLRELGEFSASNLRHVMSAIRQESSGNPRTVNNWDANAARGTPSKGLLQTIGPTFNAYAGKYRSRGPFDPHANIYAAIRYARSRYGRGWAARMDAPPGVGYANGVRNAPRGLAWVGEEGPELLNFRGGESVTPTAKSMEAVGGSITININGTIIGNEKAVEDAVVKAVKEARRKKRM